MNIDGMIVNADVQEIIDELKSQLALQGISLFAKSKDSAEDYMVCCPYHKDGQERNPSMGIRKSDGMTHCLACGVVRSLPEMICDCFNETDKTFGHKWLAQNFLSIGVGERGNIVLDCSRTNNADVSDVVLSTVTEKELDSYRYVHPYMYERGLTDDIIEEFDIGYDKATDSITFPVKDVNGKCLFVARRQIKTKRFDLPKDIEKPLYGLYEVCKYTEEHLVLGGRGRHYPISEIYVCEGLFDCLRLWCNGKFAVAGFGCLFSEYQIRQLESLPTRHLILALDNDEAGRSATERLKKRIRNKLISVVELPVGRKDIGECSDDEICKLKENLY